MAPRVLPEVGFIDDHRHFTLSSQGLALLMGTCVVVCAAACSFMQVHKLQVYYLRLDGRRMQYVRGTLPTPLGPVDQHTKGFMLTTVLLVMKEQLAKAKANLGKVGRVLGA